MHAVALTRVSTVPIHVEVQAGVDGAFACRRKASEAGEEAPHELPHRGNTGGNVREAPEEALEMTSSSLAAGILMVISEESR